MVSAQVEDELVEETVVTRKYRKKVSKGNTFILVLLDMSGSMASLRSDTIGGFNRWLEDCKQADSDALVTYVQFDSVAEMPFGKTRKLADFPVLTGAIYTPRGLTALLDAIGTQVTSLASSMQPEDRALVLITTDGQENASREYKRDGIRKLIQEKTALGNWTFTYQGANQDSFAEANTLGIAWGNTVNYTASAQGTIDAAYSRSGSTSSFLSSNLKQVGNFYEGEEKKNK